MAETKTKNPQRVVIIGQGYVGLPVAIRAVEAGFDVVGAELDQNKVDGLIAGISHIDDITDAQISEALELGRYKPTSNMADLANFDIAVITVPTPLRDGAPDMSYIESASRTVAAYIRPGSTVILESTTYPGTTEEFVAPILEEVSGLRAGDDFHLGFSPERIDPGNETWNFRRTPKIVSGLDDASLKIIQDFYNQLVDQTVATSGTREAELAKLLENTFRHVNIALVNELAVNSRALGIDFWNVVEAASTKPFGFMPFYPGPGVGGHCLPIDPSYLSWQFERELGTVSRFVKIADDINNGMPAEVVRRVQLGLNELEKSVKGSKILVVGLAYKRNSNDARETPSLPIIEGLLTLGASVSVHDSWVDSHAIDSTAKRVALTPDVLGTADAVVIVTDHDDVDYDLIAAHAPYVFDTRHRMPIGTAEAL